MAEQAFTLEEIKAAFWKTFHGAGELWFPDPSMNASERAKENANEAVDEQWCEFTKNITQPSSHSSSSTTV